MSFITPNKTFNFHGSKYTLENQTYRGYGGAAGNIAAICVGLEEGQEISLQIARNGTMEKNII